MQISIITAFPESLSFLTESINKRAQEKGALKLEIVNLLDFGLGRWKKIDDHPFGGGAGMLLQVEPLYRALKQVLPIDTKAHTQENTRWWNSKTKVVLTSARGVTWKQATAEHYAAEVKHLVIVCGHYEGVDQRFIDAFVDEEISIGDYILSGGETAAMVITDSIVRLLDNVVGNKESVEDETQFFDDYKIAEYPHYTRPETFTTDEGLTLSVPEILLSGHHAKIEAWKEENRKAVTR